jgi:hypothetical protein
MLRRLSLYEASLPALQQVCRMLKNQVMQCKHDVKVADIQQLLFSSRKPVLTCLCLALGATPILLPC